MGLYTTKETITRGEYITLAGLLAIGQRHEQEQQLIIREIAQVLGEKPDEGHASDALYSNYSVDELLRKSAITVVESPAPSPVSQTREPTE